MKPKQTLRDLSLADLLQLCDPADDPLQAELIRRLERFRVRMVLLVQERAELQTMLQDREQALEKAHRATNQLLDTLR